MKGKIYVIEFRNGMNYVGQSTHSESMLRNRYKQEIRKCKNGEYTRPVIKAMVDFGYNQCDLRIICEDIKSFDDLNTLEEFYIGMFDSYQNGYNCDVGGTNKKRTGYNKVICLQTLIVYSSALQCGKMMFGYNRSNEHLKKNIDGLTKFYNGYSFEYYDKNKCYIKRCNEEQERGYAEYEKWSSKFIYVDRKGNVTDTLNEMGKLHSISATRVGQLLGDKFIRITVGEYTELKYRFIR